MAEATYLVAFVKGHYPPDRPGEPWAVQATTPAHAIEASFQPGEQPPFTAACGAVVNFVVNGQEWPPVGITKCPQCARSIG